MMAFRDSSAALAKITRLVLLTYQPETQPTADFVKSKLGEKLRLEKFDGDGQALFVDDPEKFNRVDGEFADSSLVLTAGAVMDGSE